MTTEETLKAAYLDNGGTERGFETVKGELIAAHRKQAAINAALEESGRKPTINDYLRQPRQTGSPDIRALFPALFNQEGTNDDAA